MHSGLGRRLPHRGASKLVATVSAATVTGAGLRAVAAPHPRIAGAIARVTKVTVVTAMMIAATVTTTGGIATTTDVTGTAPGALAMGTAR